MSPYLMADKVQVLRRTQKSIPAGDAPFTDSNAFKSPEAFSKPPAKRWDHRLSHEAQARKGSTLKGFATSMDKGGIITLGTARPKGECFPWDSVDFHAQGQSMGATRSDGPFTLDVALNYGHAAGSAQLVRFFTEHVELIHNPPYSDWECVATCGNTPALDVALRTFVNRGDYVLTEEYTYSGAVEAILPLGAKIQGIRMDEDGLIPEDLDEVLSNWDLARGPKPFLLYMVPTGHNPTGRTQPAERRRSIYEVADRHDLFILEDDPYYFLTLGEPAGESNGNANHDIDIISQLPPSYLSLDRSGRVLRLDSTSKIIAPGLRCGWMTGSSQVIQKMVSLHEVGVVAPSGIAQLMLYKLLDETWGHEGFVRWLEGMSLRYRRRRDLLLDACSQHVTPGLCTWEVPTVGMFVWVDVDWRRHPKAKAVMAGGADLDAERTNALLLEIEDAIFARAVQHQVMINKGSWFRAHRGTVTGVTFRLTYAAAPEEQLADAAKRLGEALRAEFEV